MKTTHCRMCGSTDLVEWLDLGHQPHSDQFKTSRDVEEKTYPLRVGLCRSCGLNQLTFTVPKEDLYTRDYLYEASITQTADRHWTEFAETVGSKVLPDKTRVVIDIGSNDGTLLTKFQKLGYRVMGIDPCPEVGAIARARGVSTVTGFFGPETVAGLEREIDLVTGTNVFAHVNDLTGFMTTIESLLRPQGVFVFESPYLADFLSGLEYDTVYHQHLCYLSLRPAISFVERFGLEVFDVQRTELHGGGFRVYIGRKGKRPVSDTVGRLLAKETWTLADLQHFADGVAQHRDLLFGLIFSLHKQGKTIAAVSSPAKGQTLINYTGIGRFLQYATDKSQLKQGRFTPGTFIPIFSDEKLKEQPCDYNLLLAWNFAPEIMRNNPEVEKWIVPLPTVQVINTPQAEIR